MWIPKHASKNPCPSSASTWRTTNLRTLKVTKDPRRHRRTFTTFTRQRVCLTSLSFATSFSHVECKRMMTCWTTSTRSSYLRTNSFVWRYMWETKTLLWSCSRICRRHLNTWSPLWRWCWWRNLWWTIWQHIWWTICPSTRRRSPMMVLRQDKGDNSFLCQCATSYYYYVKPGHIMHFSYKEKKYKWQW